MSDGLSGLRALRGRTPNPGVQQEVTDEHWEPHLRHFLFIQKEFEQQRSGISGPGRAPDLQRTALPDRFSGHVSLRRARSDVRGALPARRWALPARRRHCRRPERCGRTAPSASSLAVGEQPGQLVAAVLRPRPLLAGRLAPGPDVSTLSHPCLRATGGGWVVSGATLEAPSGGGLRQGGRGASAVFFKIPGSLFCVPQAQPWGNGCHRKKVENMRRRRRRKGAKMSKMEKMRRRRRRQVPVSREASGRDNNAHLRRHGGCYPGEHPVGLMTHICDDTAGQVLSRGASGRDNNAHLR
eukprot:gene680-biopygen13700